MSGRSNKDWRQRLRQWQELGVTVERTGGGHLKFTHPAFPRPLFGPCTPSDHRSVINTIVLVEKNMRAAQLID